MPEAIKARFMAPAEGEPGHEFDNLLPARNILESEWETLTPEQRERAHRARLSGDKPMYDVRTDTEMHPARMDHPHTGAPLKAEAKPEPAKSDKQG